jgi:hypothetical protein
MIRYFHNYCFCLIDIFIKNHKSVMLSQAEICRGDGLATIGLAGGIRIGTVLMLSF